VDSIPCQTHADDVGVGLLPRGPSDERAQIALEGRPSVAVTGRVPAVGRPRVAPDLPLSRRRQCLSSWEPKGAPDHEPARLVHPFDVPARARRNVPISHERHPACGGAVRMGDAQPQIPVLGGRQQGVGGKSSDLVEHIATQQDARRGNEVAEQQRLENVAFNQRLNVALPLGQRTTCADVDAIGEQQRCAGPRRGGQLLFQFIRQPGVVRIEKGKILAAARALAGIARRGGATIGLPHQLKRWPVTGEDWPC
jgi:hypothetical protein